MTIGDPFILLSVVNTKLRDSSLTLQDIAADYEATEAELREALAAAGYTYSENTRQFVQK